MSESSTRPGMKWARWRERLAWTDGDDLRGHPLFLERVKARFDDERRALVRAALTGLVTKLKNIDDASLLSAACALAADAVLARYDEEVEE